MNLAQLRWLAVISAVLGLILLETFRHGFLERILPPLAATVFADLVLLLGAVAFIYYVVGWIGRISDRLARQQQKLNAVVEHSSDALLLSDAKGIILSANPAAVTLTGRSESALVGMPLWQVLCRTPYGHPLTMAECPAVQVARSGQSLPYAELTVAAADARLLPVTASFSPVPGEPGAAMQVAIVLRDLSEKRALEAHVQRLLAETDERRRQAETLYQVGRSLSSLQETEHNLNDPLAQVRGVLAADLAVYAALDAGEIRCFGSSGAYDPARASALRLRPGQGLIGRVIGSGQNLQAENLFRTADPLLEPEGLAVATAVPVHIRGEVIGALLVGRRRPTPFRAGSSQFLESVAGQLGIAMENFRLYRQAEKVAMLEERDRLAREIHDGVAQSLAFLHFRLEALALRAGAGAVADLPEQLDRLKASCQEAYGEVRQAILNLRQRPLNGTDLGSYLTEYLDEVGRAHQLDVEVVLPPTGLPALSPTAEAHLIRIVQEALHNVVRHARAQRVVLRCALSGDRLQVVLTDDGIGFEPDGSQHPGHIGLAVMQERAVRAGGQLAVHSVAGAGTRVEVSLPLTPAAEHPLWEGRATHGDHPNLARG